jgi:PAS domain S-box-containing protein
MPKGLRALIVEDVEQDAILLVRALTRGGYDVTFDRVETREAMLSALESREWDVILSDYSLPRFSAPAALELTAELGLDLPFIIVSGTVNEDIAVESLHAGAHDFMAKGKLGRLIPAIERELRDAALRAERARMQREMDEAREHLDAVLSFAPVFILAVDREGRIRFINRTFPHHQRDQVIGSSWLDYLPEEDHPRLRVLLDHVLEVGVPQTFEVSQYRADGPAVWFTCVMGPIRHGANIVGAVITAQDITDLKQSQERLRVSDRMASVGALAAGVAHDFNNILAVIRSYASFVRDELPDADERRADIDEVLMAADRAVGLTRQLLTFARQQPKLKKPTDLNERLKQLRGLLARSLGSHIELVTTFSSQAAVVLIDPVEFDQVVLNLVVNARDAMPNGGRVTIAIEESPATGAIGGHAGIIRLTVTDTGLGIDERTRRRIFEPFFTTKEQGKGTGLGLATCVSIVEDAGGGVSVQSEPGVGTTFVIELPNCAESRDSDRPAERISYVGRGEVVLVAEDEPSLRRAALRILENASYVVHTASTGSEAIDMIDTLGMRLDVIITDIVMPGCSGYDVAAHAARVAPRAAVILTSGYLTDSLRRNHRDDLPLLWKPVAEQDLLSAIRQAVSRKRTVPPSVAGTMVLIVEDDAPIAAALTRFLERAGCATETASSLADARRALELGLEPRFLLCDLSLPDGSGAELIEWIERARPALSSRVVVMTGGAVDEAGARVIKSRSYRVMQKPCDPKVLLELVAGGGA